MELGLLLSGFSEIKNILYPKHKQCRAKLVWDELRYTFDIAILNRGQASIMINSVELFYKVGIKKMSLGVRENFCDAIKESKIIEQGKAVTYEPIYGSTYDVFGYKGHVFDVDSTNEDKKVYIELIDIEGKKYVSKSGYKLGEIDKLIDRHNAVAVGRWEKGNMAKKVKEAD